MVRAIVGANWGDEGKGKITDMLSKESDIIVRFQGGANAGHTIVNDYGKFALHTLPSGVFYGHTTSILGNGVALNIPVLFQEIKDLIGRGVIVKETGNFFTTECTLSDLAGNLLAGATIKYIKFPVGRVQAGLDAHEELCYFVEDGVTEIPIAGM